MDKPALTAKARYDRRVSDRWNVLDRARQCSELTIPHLIPPAGHNQTTKYHTPWQGIGARGVNNLASKLLLAMLPPNSPFFKLTVDEFTKDKLAGDPAFKSKIDEGFSKMERAVQDEIEGSAIRNPVFLALKHLIVGGNYLLYLPAKGTIKGYPLERYVVTRDCDGNLLEVIALECVDQDTLSPEVLSLLDDNDEVPGDDGPKSQKPEDDQKYEEVEIYTRWYLDSQTWKCYQEINGKIVPGSQGSWPMDESPIMALRWSHVSGEDYGRGYVEEYIGDLISLESLSKSIVEGAAIAAKIVFLVSPNGVTKASDLTEAENGDAITGMEQDVHSLQAEKQADLKVAQETIQMLTERMAFAFLLQTSIQRNGERVTAEEIRYMAGELEDALGGVYSVLSQEFQLPFIKRLIARMTKAKKLPPLPKGVVKPAIVTGLEALGRGHDLQKLNTWITQVVTPVGQVAGPQALSRIDTDEILLRGATALGIDTAGLLKSDEKMQQEQQAQQDQASQQQQAEIAKSAAPAAVKAVSDNVIAAGQQGQAPQAPAKK